MASRLVTGMIPGTTGLSTPRAARSSTSDRYSSGREEELGYGEVGQPHLLGQEIPVRLHVGRAGVPGGMGRHPDAESADGPGQLHQLDGVDELTLGRVGIGRRIATEGHEVLNPGLAEVDQDLGQLQAGVGGADQVGHRGQRGGAQHPDHEIVGSLARRTTAPVGDRHERRTQRLQVHQSFDQAGVLGVVLGREELERVSPP